MQLYSGIFSFVHLSSEIFTPTLDQVGLNLIREISPGPGWPDRIDRPGTYFYRKTL